MKHNTLVEIQKLRAESDWVDDVERWDRVCDMYVSIMPTNGREVIDNDRIATEATHIIRTNYDQRITSQMRAVDKHRKRVFEFVSVINNEERSRTLRIDAKERT